MKNDARDFRTGRHPYIGRSTIGDPEASRKAVEQVNEHRGNSRGPHVSVTYYFEAFNPGNPLEGLKEVAKMTLEHGTLKPWEKEGEAGTPKPAGYDENMSWLEDIQLLSWDRQQGVESGLVTVAWPLFFFDRRGDDRFPFAQLMMAVASEPVTAFTLYRAARLVDIRFPAELARRFPGVRWPHRRIREYLGLQADEPIIGTIVKPKTGLTPEIFARCVTEAAVAGAVFTKADENLHLSAKDLSAFVDRTVKELEQAGFDLGRPGGAARGKRFLFAPHITVDADRIREHARVAVESGANALMFSPHHGGGLPLMGEIAGEFDVPVYAHTAGMNLVTGSPSWGMDPRILYMLTARFAGAFMQLPAVRGYIRPDDEEKPEILKRLQEENLCGNDGMTLVIAGGLGPSNIGLNMKTLGAEGRMFLAGTSVYSHPDGPSSGVKALILACRAFREKGLTETADLMEYGRSLGRDGEALVHALQK